MFFKEFISRKKSKPSHQKLFVVLVEMAFGLVHASYSLSEWQAAELPFLHPGWGMQINLHHNALSSSFKVLACTKRDSCTSVGHGNPGNA